MLYYIITCLDDYKKISENQTHNEKVKVTVYNIDFSRDFKINLGKLNLIQT